MVKNVSDSWKNACNNYEINVYNISMRNHGFCSHTIRNCEFSSTHLKIIMKIYIKTKCTKIGEKKAPAAHYTIDWEWCEAKEYKKIKPLKSINNVFNDNQNSTIFY